MLSLETPSRAREVARYIEELIDQRGLQEGDRVGTKDEFRREIGVARATINEAVKLLHERGRVTMRSGPKGGVFVSKADPSIQLGRFLLAVGKDAKGVADAMALRDFLEEMVLKEAVLHRTDEDIKDLRGCIAELETNHGDSQRFVESIWNLHRRIAQISANITLKTTYIGLLTFIQDQVTGFNEPTRNGQVDYERERIDVHAALVDAIASGDMKRVEPAVARHNESN